MFLIFGFALQRFGPERAAVDPGSDEGDLIGGETFGRAFGRRHDFLRVKTGSLQDVFVVIQYRI